MSFRSGLEILSAETRTELYKKQKASGTVRREGHKIYLNDPCPCGSGKKYKSAAAATHKMKCKPLPIAGSGFFIIVYAD